MKGKMRAIVRNIFLNDIFKYRKLTSLAYTLRKFLNKHDEIQRDF